LNVISYVYQVFEFGKGMRNHLKSPRFHKSGGQASSTVERMTVDKTDLNPGQVSGSSYPDESQRW
jgi:hypothetical protein